MPVIRSDWGHQALDRSFVTFEVLHEGSAQMTQGTGDTYVTIVPARDRQYG